MFLALLVATQSKLGLQSVLLLPHSSRLYLVVGVATDLKSFPLAAAESWCRGKAHWGGVAGSPSGAQLEQPVQHCRESPLLYVSGAKGPPAPHSQHLLSLIPCVLQQNFWLSLALGWCVLIFIFKKKKECCHSKHAAVKIKWFTASFSPVPLLKLWNTKGNIWISDWGWRSVPSWNPLSAHSLQLWNYRCESFPEFSELLKALSVDFSGAALNCLCRVEL